MISYTTTYRRKETGGGRVDREGVENRVEEGSARCQGTEEGLGEEGGESAREGGDDGGE